MKKKGESGSEIEKEIMLPDKGSFVGRRGCRVARAGACSTFPVIRNSVAHETETDKW